MYYICLLHEDRSLDDIFTLSHIHVTMLEYSGQTQLHYNNLSNSVITLVGGRGQNVLHVSYSSGQRFLTNFFSLNSNAGSWKLS